jgi:hypothetical protein
VVPHLCALSRAVMSIALIGTARVVRPGLIAFLSARGIPPPGQDRAQRSSYRRIATLNEVRREGWSMRKYSILGLLLLPIVCVACGSSALSGGQTTVGGSSGSSTPKNVAPGYRSPRAAVTGLLIGIQENQSSTICAYVVPSRQDACRSAFTAGFSVSLGEWRLGNDVIHGDQAIVSEIVSDACATGQSCISNSDPNAGLPQNVSDFANAYNRALTDSTDPANACEQIGGQWYVVLNID